MAAPQGNKYWILRSKHGRDAIFKDAETLEQECFNYFNDVDDNPIEIEDNKGTKNVNKVKLKRPYTQKGLCIYLDISEETWREYRKREDLFEVIRKIDDIIYNQKFEGATIGIFKENIISRSLGLKDGSDVTSNGKTITPPIQWE